MRSLLPCAFVNCINESEQSDSSISSSSSSIVKLASFKISKLIEEVSIPLASYIQKLILWIELDVEWPSSGTTFEISGTLELIENENESPSIELGNPYPGLI